VSSVQVGLNETPLTKALVAGQFGLAEKLILENTDVDYLNDGKSFITHCVDLWTNVMVTSNV